MGNPKFQDPDQPVQGVSYNDAILFCKQLGDLDGNLYTLPTDAQWEYACRAGTKLHLFGDSDNPGLVAWYRDNSDGILHPVGTKKPNAWGIYDMIGGVREWCFDGPGQYDSLPARDPRGPNAGPLGIARGGSWGDEPSFCRSAYRTRIGIDRRHSFVGLRLVLVKKGAATTQP